MSSGSGRIGRVTRGGEKQALDCGRAPLGSGKGRSDQFLAAQGGTVPDWASVSVWAVGGASCGSVYCRVGSGSSTTHHWHCGRLRLTLVCLRFRQSGLMDTSTACGFVRHFFVFFFFPPGEESFTAHSPWTTTIPWQGRCAASSRLQRRRESDSEPWATFPRPRIWDARQRLSVGS